MSFVVHVRPEPEVRLLKCKWIRPLIYWAWLYHGLLTASGLVKLRPCPALFGLIWFWILSLWAGPSLDFYISAPKLKRIGGLWLWLPKHQTVGYRAHSLTKGVNPCADTWARWVDRCEFNIWQVGPPWLIVRTNLLMKGCSICFQADHYYWSSLGNFVKLVNLGRSIVKACLTFKLFETFLII